VADDYKLQIYIRIARLLLEDEDSVGAESYINRAGYILSPESTDKVLQLQVDIPSLSVNAINSPKHVPAM
jgi:hypothetical protein